MGTTSAAAKKRWAKATMAQRRAMGRRTADEKEEFFRRVDKNGPTMPHMKTRCWVWTGFKRNGYGRFTVLGKYYNAHVRALEMKLGVSLKPPGERALHRCDNRACVRGSHLFKGTQRDNVIDSARKGGHKNPILHGHRNPNAKLTCAQVRRLRLNPPPMGKRASVARKLGVSSQTVCRILRGVRWGGVAT